MSKEKKIIGQEDDTKGILDLDKIKKELNAPPKKEQKSSEKDSPPPKEEKKQ